MTFWRVKLGKKIFMGIQFSVRKEVNNDNSLVDVQNRNIMNHLNGAKNGDKCRRICMNEPQNVF